MSRNKYEVHQKPRSQIRDALSGGDADPAQNGAGDANLVPFLRAIPPIDADRTESVWDDAEGDGGADDLPKADGGKKENNLHQM